MSIVAGLLSSAAYPECYKPPESTGLKVYVDGVPAKHRVIAGKVILEEYSPGSIITIERRVTK